MKITTREAVVKTMAVEVKSLTISGKQVTLAVFRQLEEEVLIHPETVLFRGLPWGRVNYHPDPACKESGTHVHVVWQRGDELRRSTVRPRGWDSLRAWWDASEARQNVDEALALMLLESGCPPPAYRGKQITPSTVLTSYSDQPGMEFTMGGSVIFLHIPYEMARELRWRDYEKPLPQKEAERLVSLRSWLRTQHRAETLAEVRALRRPLAEKDSSFRVLWEARYAELEALDQLFIAV